MNGDFAALKTHITEQGLFQPTSAFYVRRATMAMGLVAVSIVLITTVTSFWAQMTNAVLLAFAFGQLGLFSHDLGHGQVASKHWHKLLSSWLNITLGWNLTWWIQKHSQHHAFPNSPIYDPDMDIQFLAFSEDQARQKKGWLRFVARHQHLLFIPLLMFETWNLRCASIRYLLLQRTMKAYTELSLIAIHLILYLAVLFIFLPPFHALAFILVHTGLLGVYLGLIFAPNHKGMLIIEQGKSFGYFRTQVLTSRNVRGGWLVDFIYGGLNYQIEHHLFPSMPRNRLKHAALIIERFCREKNVPYASVSVPESFRRIFGYLAHVGKAVPHHGS